MSNFDPGSVNGLVGLWDFLSGSSTKDTGLADGIAQNGHFHGHAFASGGQAHFDGYGDYFDVSGTDAPFDMDKGTLEVSFSLDKVSGDQTIVNRGEYDDKSSEGHFMITVKGSGEIEVRHHSNGEHGHLDSPDGFVNPGDEVKVTYSWDIATGATATFENITTGETETVTEDMPGLTMDIGDNDAENFTFGAREKDDGEYDDFMDGKISYVAIYDTPSAGPGPSGAVDGEDSS